MFNNFRLSKYLTLTENENEGKHLERLGQFDVGYHNISFDDDPDLNNDEIPVNSATLS